MTDSAVATVHSPCALRDRDGFLPAPFAAMRETGTASITLGTVFDVADVNTLATFKSVATLSEHSRLPVATTRKHLNTLRNTGWLEYLGRQRSNGSRRPRRTATYRLTEKARAQKRPFAAWPRWLGEWPPDLTRTHGLIYATILSRACLVEDVENQGVGAAYDRLAISYSEFQRLTGLGRQTVWRALDALTNPQVPLVSREKGEFALVLPTNSPVCAAASPSFG